jgi:tungstate transport system substrate-binding protein
VIVVQGENVNQDCAQEFSGWITSQETQKEIGQFGAAEFGEPLFHPDAEG